MSLHTTTAKRLKVIVSAYACEPNQGSEPGVGWNFVHHLASFCDVCVITRKNNRPVIENFYPTEKPCGLEFIFYDPPQSLTFWKKGNRGIHLYYILWQIGCFFCAYKQCKKKNFDIAHHITFGSDFFFSSFAFLGLPFVWGPVGHREGPPRYFSKPGFRLWFRDILKRKLREVLWRFDPLLQHTLKRADYILAISPELMNIPGWKKHANKIRNLPAIAIENTLPKQTPIHRTSTNKEIKVLFAGELIPEKGYDIALESFILASQSSKKLFSLVYFGHGHGKTWLENTIRKRGLQEKVYLKGNQPRQTLLMEMRHSDIFLFPSFEGAAMVTLEAMGLALPTVMLHHGVYKDLIPQECALKVKPTHYSETVSNLAKAIVELAEDEKLRVAIGTNAKQYVQEHCTLSSQKSVLSSIYAERMRETS